MQSSQRLCSDDEYRPTWVCRGGWSHGRVRLDQAGRGKIQWSRVSKSKGLSVCWARKRLRHESYQTGIPICFHVGQMKRWKKRVCPFLEEVAQALTRSSACKIATQLKTEDRDEAHTSKEADMNKASELAKPKLTKDKISTLLCLLGIFRNTRRLEVCESDSHF